MRVAVLGAGASGLTAIKSCLEEGLDVTCFERTSHLGGLWYYTTDAVEGQGCVAKSTVINTSKEMMCFSDYPIPSDYPVFMHNKKVLSYFELYAEKFNLKKYIKFKTTIKRVERAPDYDTTGKWKLTIVVDGKENTEIYDAVLLCTGHHADKRVPTFKGLDKFKGTVTHSHDYKDPNYYDDSRVLVIGIGNSGGDVSVELAKRAKQVYLSTRRGTWIFARTGPGGLPVDMQNTSRSKNMLVPYVGLDNVERFIERQLNARFNHEMYGLKPAYGCMRQHPMVNDELPNRILSGTVQVKPDVSHFTENAVVFNNGDAEEIDHVILATGYSFGFPYLEEGLIDTTDNKAPLFKYIFPPNLNHNTLAIAGFVQPWGAVMPLSELQCRLAARVFTGAVKLPSQSRMQKDVDEIAEIMRKRYVASPRHTIQVDWIVYADEVAELIGCRPDLKKLFWDDFKLWFKVVFGPCTPYQFRIHGPGAWEGAKDAIMTQWDRTMDAINTRTNKQYSKRSGNFFVFKLILFLIVLYIIWLYLF